jgi:predicted ATPase
MIREWRIGRFKSFATSTSLAFRPLTILAGPNSSGKSSIIQSVLLVAQSLSSRVPDRQLILNGDKIRLGTFGDVLTQQSDESTIEFGFDINLPFATGTTSIGPRPADSLLSGYFAPTASPDAALAISADLTFGPSGPPGRETVDTALHAQVVAASFRTTLDSRQGQLFSGDEEGGDDSVVTIERRSDAQVDQVAIGIVNEPLQTLREALRYSVLMSPRVKASLRRGRADLQLQDTPGEIVAAAMSHFLPSGLMWKQDAIERVLRSTLRRLSTVSTERLESTLTRLAESSDPIQSAIGTAVRQLASQVERAVGDVIRDLRSSKSEPESKQRLLAAARDLAGEPWRRAIAAVEGPLPEEYEFAFQGVQDLFRNIRYLGPLRDDPKPLYAMSGAIDPTDVGAKGEYTAAVLDANSHIEVEFVHPADGKATKARLSEAVLLWLQHFRMADAIRTSDEPKLGHRLLIRPTGIRVYVDLTNVGVGVSQVLPIVVMALISPPQSVLLFEQPELHLHPAVQSQLGDFFAAVARTGRQCLVETHSEYLINRIRLRIAEADDAEIADSTMVHFVERRGSATGLSPVVINEYGAIPEWPTGFFDQGPQESESILHAALAKKGRKRRGEPSR